MGTATQPVAKRKSLRRFAITLGIVALIFAATVAAVVYLTSDSFREYVRARVVTQLEQMTGGRVELGRLNWNLSRLQVDAENLTIHGLEGPGEVPYAHFDHMRIKMKIFSLLQEDLGIHELQLEHPVLHLIVYPDGHTNQPIPPKARVTAKPDIQQLFHLEIGQAEVRDGTLILNEQRIPFNVSAREVGVQMSYAAREDEYRGNLRLGEIDLKYGSYAPTQVNAEMKFILGRDRVDVSSARLGTPKSTLNFAAHLAKFSAPVVSGNFQGKLDLAEAGAFVRSAELKSGTAQVRGSFEYAGGGYSSSGNVVVNGVEYRSREFAVRDAEASADYSVTPKKLAVRNVMARVFAGTLRGELAIDNWTSATTPPSRKAKNGVTQASVQSGAGQFRCDNISAHALLEGISRPSLQLKRLNSVGTINGSGTIKWKGSIDSALIGFDASVAPPARLSADSLPLSANVHGSYELATQRVELSQFNLDARDLQASGSGSLGHRGERLNLKVVVQDLSRLQSLLASLNRPVPELAGISGTGRFQGSITGPLNEPCVSGRIQIENLTAPLAMIQQQKTGTTAPSSETVHFDALSGDLDYSPDKLTIRNGLARREAATAKFNFSSSLRRGELYPDAPITGQVSLENESIAVIQKALGYNYPVDGIASAHIQLQGTKAAPAGSGHVQIQGATLYGEPVKEISGDVAFSQTRLAVTHLTLVQNGARAVVTGYYDLDSTAFEFQASGDHLELSNIHYLQTPKVQIAGKLSFTVEGSGTTGAPVINGNVRASKLVLNGQKVGDISAEATTKGETMELTAHSDFERAHVVANGTVRLRGDFPAQATATFADFNLAPFLPKSKDISTRLAGSMQATMPLRDWKQLNGKVEISQLAATLYGVHLANSGPIRMGVTAQQVQIESLKIQGDDTELTASGTVSLNQRKTLKISANGHVNLRLAQTIDPDLVTSGSMNVNLDIAGSLTRPRMLGQVTIANGAIALIDLPNGLSNVNGTLVFDQDQLSVQAMTARTGGGEVRIGGYISYRNELSFNLTAAGNDIRLRYPQGVSSSANMDLRLSGTLKTSTLSGDITVTRFGITPQFDLALYLARSKMVSLPPNPDSPTYNLHLDMHVVSTPELQVQTTVGRLAGDVDLRVRGTAAKPVVLGRINITEGQIAFNGTNYELRRGDITFTNPVGIVPVFNIEAGTRIRNYDITLTFHGDVNRLVTNYRSDPPLPEADVISLLAFGRTREETDLSSSGFALNGTMSNALLGEALNSAVGDRVTKLFGVSRIKISPDYATTTTNPAAQVTIEQQVSKKLTVTYITSLTQTTYSQQAIQVEYNINRNVSVVGGRDLYGIVSFDVKIRQRKQ